MSSFYDPMSEMFSHYLIADQQRIRFLTGFLQTGVASSFAVTVDVAVVTREGQEFRPRLWLTPSSYERIKHLVDASCRVTATGPHIPV